MCWERRVGVKSVKSHSSVTHDHTDKILVMSGYTHVLLRTLHAGFFILLRKVVTSSLAISDMARVTSPWAGAGPDAHS